MIHKIIPRIIRWVNINHLDLTHIRVLEQLQYFKIVSLNIKVLRFVPVHTLFGTRAQSLIDRCSRLLQGSTFTHPSKVIHFGSILHGFVPKKLTKFVEINYTMYFSIIALCLREARRHNLVKGFQIQFFPIWRLPIYTFQFFHI